MKKLHQAALGIALLSLAGIAGAQAPAAPSGSNDPFVDCRNEIAAAKKAYKAKKISKKEYEQEKLKAKDKLKATGVRSDTEKSLDCR